MLNGLEAATRLDAFPSSRDFKRFSTYPGAAEALAQGEGLRLAFIGAGRPLQKGFDSGAFKASLAGSPDCCAR